MRASRDVIRETEDAFARRFGRAYCPTEDYRCEDADVVVVALGTLGKEAEVAVDLLREEGVKAGVHAPPLVPAVPEPRPRRPRRRGHRPRLLVRLGGVVAQSIRATTRAEPSSVIAGLRRPGGHLRRHRAVRQAARSRDEFWFGVSD